VVIPKGERNYPFELYAQNVDWRTYLNSSSFKGETKLNITWAF
jgi:hypothetical protein